MDVIYLYLPAAIGFAVGWLVCALFAGDSHE